MMKSLYLAFLFLSFFLYACGGGGSAKKSLTDDQSSVFYSLSNKTNNSLSDIQTVVDSIDELSHLNPIYDVTTYKLEYNTFNTKNEEIKVSGLVAVPNTVAASPILSFQHGTIFKNNSAPSFQLKVSKKSPEILFASLGYIVFSPDYIGYGTSFGEEHPYLQKNPSADSVIDMLKAGKFFLKKEGIATNNKLFLTGYSQGGYVTMAALEALQNAQENDLSVTAAVLGAGPYDVYTILNELLHHINKLPSSFDKEIIKTLKSFLIKKDADVSFDDAFLQHYLNKDKSDDVYRWKPNIPLKLFHGKDDKTVPIEAAISTQKYMKGVGADVELVNCTAKPATHSACALPYLNYTINYFSTFH